MKENFIFVVRSNIPHFDDQINAESDKNQASHEVPEILLQLSANAFNTVDDCVVEFEDFLAFFDQLRAKFLIEIFGELVDCCTKIVFHLENGFVWERCEMTTWFNGILINVISLFAEVLHEFRRNFSFL